MEILCSLLGPTVSVLEYGAGGSTTFFSQFVKSWVSVEHDTAWAVNVSQMLSELPWGDRVTVHTVQPDTPYEGGFAEGTEEQFRSYISYPATLQQKFDVILDDGRARLVVSKAVLENRLFRNSKSKLVIHDWERVYYKDMVKKLGYRVHKQDIKSKRHLASLYIPLNYD